PDTFFGQSPAFTLGKFPAASLEPSRSGPQYTFNSMSDDLPSTNDAPGLTGWWSRLFQNRGDDLKGREEIAAFLAESRHRGLLAADEYAMLQGVLEVSLTHVRDIMVPRSHMVVLEKDASLESLLKTIVESGHSRFPV